MMHKRFWSLFMFAGILLILASMGLVVYNLYTEQNAGVLSAGILQDIASQMAGIEEPEPELTPDGTYQESLEMPVLAVDGLDYIAAVHIPSISLEVPVLAD